MGTTLAVDGLMNGAEGWDASCTSSKLKRTPPIGAPKATDTPAADAAERTWEEKTNAPQLTRRLLSGAHEQQRLTLRPSHLSFLGLVLAVLGEEVGEDVPAAAGHVDQRALLPQAEAGRHSQHQSDGFDHQGPLA